MGLLSHTFNTLNDLFLHELRDLYDAENRITEALPKMVEVASSGELKQAFQNHLKETEQHVTRLEQIFKKMDVEAKRETCPAIKGILAEGQQMLSATGSDTVRDAALIAAAQRVEHYEMAGYGTVRTFARQLGLDEVAGILQKTLDEEGMADKKLTEIAETRVNVQAGHVVAGAHPIHA